MVYEDWPIDLAPIVRDRSVAVIGHASSLLGGGYGPEIDQHDVVVRLNLCLPIPDKVADMGTATHLCYVGSIIRRPENSEILATGKFKGMPVCGKKFVLLDDMREYWSPMEPDRHSELAPPRTSSCTGVVAVFDCLLAGAAKLSIYGFDFYASRDTYTWQQRDVGRMSTLPKLRTSFENDRKRLVMLEADGHPVRFDRVLTEVLKHPITWKAPLDV